jgi:Glycosyl hydrolases family 16
VLGRPEEDKDVLLKVLREQMGRSRVRVALLLVAALLAATLAQLSTAGAGSITYSQNASTDDSGVVDLNHDGVADYARYGITNSALSVGEQPSDGSDLRLFIPFDLSSTEVSTAKAGGSAKITVRVWRADNVKGQKLVVDSFTGSGAALKSDYNRVATPVTTVAPAVGMFTFDATDVVQAMPGAGRITFRFRLSPAPPLDRLLTQVNIATMEAGTAANRPVMTITSAPPVTAPPAVSTTTEAPTTTTTEAPTTTTTEPPTTTTAPPTPEPDAVGQPPADVTGGSNWDVKFNEQFDNPSELASTWDSGMRSGAMTLEGNTELEYYQPANSVLTSDNDNGKLVPVLQQRLLAEQVPGKYYTVRTICRLYPQASYPQFYDSSVDNTCSSSNTNKTKVPYQFTSGMLNSAKSFAYRYGYVEAKVKMPKGFGFWPALWLRDWQPWSYETDVMEGFDQNARTFRSTYWWGNGQHYSTQNDSGGDVGLFNSGGVCHAYSPVPISTTTPGKCSTQNAVDLSTGYHTIGMNWTPTEYDFYLDGQKVWQSAAGADIDQAYNHLIINLAFGNNQYEFDWTKAGTKPFDANVSGSDPTFPKPTIEWQYVRVWQAPGSSDVCTSGNCPG